jgi:hypothetical protein
MVAWLQGPGGAMISSSWKFMVSEVRLPSTAEIQGRPGFQTIIELKHHWKHCVPKAAIKMGATGENSVKDTLERALW